MNRPVRILLVSALLAALPAGTASSAGETDGPAAGARSAPKPAAEIRGEVAHPGAYELREGETLSSLILRAGGFTDAAWLPGAVLLRKTGKARQAEEMTGIAERLESALPPPGPGGPESDPMRSFLAALARLSPSGRVPVRLSRPRLMINGPQDLAVEDGDRLFIPSAPRSVRVAGAVRDPGEVPASPGALLSRYAESAGGLLPEADRGGTILLKADGTARMLFEGWIVWNGDAGRWELSPFRKDRPRIEAGDTIFVPRDPGGMPWPGGIRDYRRTQMRILALTGTGVAW